MLELTGIAALLRGVGALYWLLAIGAVTLALVKGKGRKGKAIWASVAAAVFGFLPGMALVESYQKDAYAKEAWAYFRKKCETEAGEKIYKTFTGVKSVLVVKPLPPATERDLFDQYWYGDPYSSETALPDRGLRHARTLIGEQRFVDGKGEKGFDFIEMLEGAGRYVRIDPMEIPPYQVRTEIEKPSSRFGVEWQDISTPQDRAYWVAGSRLSIVDLVENRTVAVRTGYLIEAGHGSRAGQRRPWQTSRNLKTTCPSIRNGTFEDRWFVLKVLNPRRGEKNGR